VMLTAIDYSSASERFSRPQVPQRPTSVGGDLAARQRPNHRRMLDSLALSCLDL
jgi:hypothetical protein